MINIKNYPKIGKVYYQAKKQKTIRLYFKDDYIKVSYPLNVSFNKVEDFVFKKTDWIMQNKPISFKWQSGLKIANKYILELKDEKIKTSINKGLIICHNQRETIEKAVKLALKMEARDKLMPLIEQCIRKTKLEPLDIKFKYMKTQWGSCSSKGVISFNTSLIYLPKDLNNYVIIHELCHLKFLNHSDNFWQLVALYIPNYRSCQRTLKKYSASLM